MACPNSAVLNNKDKTCRKIVSKQASQKMSKRRHKQDKIIASFNCISYPFKIIAFAGLSGNAKLDKAMNSAMENLRERRGIREVLNLPYSTART